MAKQYAQEAQAEGRGLFPILHFVNLVLSRRLLWLKLLMENWPQHRILGSMMVSLKKPAAREFPQGRRGAEMDLEASDQNKKTVSLFRETGFVKF